MQQFVIDTCNDAALCRKASPIRLLGVKAWVGRAGGLEWYWFLHTHAGRGSVGHIVTLNVPMKNDVVQLCSAMLLMIAIVLHSLH